MKRSFFEITADYFIEASVLILVFALLDKAVQGQPIELGYGFKSVGIALGLFFIGLFLESRRKF